MRQKSLGCVLFFLVLSSQKARPWPEGMPRDDFRHTTYIRSYHRQSGRQGFHHADRQAFLAADVDQCVQWAVRAREEGTHVFRSELAMQDRRDIWQRTQRLLYGGMNLRSFRAISQVMPGNAQLRALAGQIGQKPNQQGKAFDRQHAAAGDQYQFAISRCRAGLRRPLRNAQMGKHKSCHRDAFPLQCLHPVQRAGSQYIRCHGSQAMKGQVPIRMTLWIDVNAMSTRHIAQLGKLPSQERHGHGVMGKPEGVDDKRAVFQMLFPDDVSQLLPDKGSRCTGLYGVEPGKRLPALVAIPPFLPEQAHARRR